LKILRVFSYKVWTYSLQYVESIHAPDLRIRFFFNGVISKPLELLPDGKVNVDVVLWNQMHLVGISIWLIFECLMLRIVWVISVRYFQVACCSEAILYSIVLLVLCTVDYLVFNVSMLAIPDPYNVGLSDQCLQLVSHVIKIVASPGNRELITGPFRSPF
jgi:hypothetical protein